MAVNDWVLREFPPTTFDAPWQRFTTAPPEPEHRMVVRARKYLLRGRP